MSLVVEGKGVEIIRDGRTVVQASDFTIPEASITAVIGPNGSGKSTLLHAITGLLERGAGSLHINGKEPADARADVAYVLQHMNVSPGIPMTVREVVAMGRYPRVGFFKRLTREDRKRVQESMELLHIDDLADRQVSQLSGGQRQRVFVAQAIAQEHTILLMDEPLTGLDIQSAQTIDHIIHEEPARGCSVIFTTHDLEEARAADTVILMSGSVVACGPPDQVLTPENLARAYGLVLLHPEFSGGLEIIDGGHEDLHSHDGEGDKL
jgi:iron complex transport system ATP-binding protein